MDIELDGKYKIVTLDDLNLALQELKEVKSKKTGKVSKKWQTIGFYSTIQSALKGYSKIAARNNKATSIDELLDEVKNIGNIINKLEL